MKIISIDSRLLAVPMIPVAPCKIKQRKLNFENVINFFGKFFSWLFGFAFFGFLGVGHVESVVFDVKKIDVITFNFRRSEAFLLFKGQEDYR